MRLLIISDSHGSGIVDRIINIEKDAKHIFFLGDVLGDIEDLKYEYSDRIFHIVPGNCDFYSQLSPVDLVDIEGVKIFYTHGHLHGVKYTTVNLLEAAKNCGADIALFGHTHIPVTEYEDGVHIVNPGSCSRPRDGGATYAVIDLLPSGILPTIKKI